MHLSSTRETEKQGGRESAKEQRMEAGERQRGREREGREERRGGKKRREGRGGDSS